MGEERHKLNVSPTSLEKQLRYVRIGSYNKDMKRAEGQRCRHQNVDYCIPCEEEAKKRPSAIHSIIKEAT